MTIGELARRYRLSRSTLLYYDRIGVLRPAGRSAAGYRRYNAADQHRLARICRYRRAGLPLATIAELLDSPDADLTEALARQLDLIGAELRRLRDQQQLVLDYLTSADRGSARVPVLTGERFIDLFVAAGVSAEQRARWHAAFERGDAPGHQMFLEFLCFRADEIAQIRRWATAAQR